jgi:hypothetical protein
METLISYTLLFGSALFIVTILYLIAITLNKAITLIIKK